MDCMLFSDNISAYIDDELTAEERERFDTHLQSCSSCRRAYKDICNLTLSLHSLGSVDLPRDFSADFANGHFAAKPSPVQRKATLCWQKSVRCRRAVTLAASFVFIALVAVAAYMVTFAMEKTPESNVGIHEQNKPEPEAKINGEEPSLPAEEDTPSGSGDGPVAEDERVSLSEAALNEIDGGDLCAITIESEHWETARDTVQNASLSKGVEVSGDIVTAYCVADEAASFVTTLQESGVVTDAAGIQLIKAEARDDWRQIIDQYDESTALVAEKQKAYDDAVANGKDLEKPKEELAAAKAAREPLFNEVNFVKFQLKKGA